MKNFILIGALTGMVLGATSASAQRWRYYDDRYYARHYYDRDNDNDKKSDDKKKASEKESGDKDDYYYCEDAWRKNMKRMKKEFKARECYYDDRPFSAERKLYKADKKAWKRDMKEYDRDYGYYYYDKDYDKYYYYNRW